MKNAIRIVSLLAVLPVLYSGVTMTMLYIQIYTQYVGGASVSAISPSPVDNAVAYTGPFLLASIFEACLGLPLVAAAGILGLIDAIRRRRIRWMVTLLLVAVLALLVGVLVLPQFSNGLTMTIVGPGLDVTVMTAPLSLAGVVADSVGWFVLSVVPLVALAYSFWPAPRKPLPDQPRHEPPLGASQPVDVT